MKTPPVPHVPLRELIYSADKFVARDIPPRKWLVRGAIPHPSIGMMYAWRGSGKTYTALQLALDVAAGRKWMPYPVERNVGVLYIDGEMPLPDLAARLRDLAGGVPPRHLYLLASEDLAAKGRSLNFANEQDRQELGATVAWFDKHAERPIEFIILDNWASLITGLDENDNTAIDAIKRWLIMFRHGERSVLIVHHAGKSGEQRGASAREDPLDYSMLLSKDATISPKESKFRLQWDKTRGARPEPDEFVQYLWEDEDGHVHMQLDSEGQAVSWEDILLAVADHPHDTHSELAEALGVSRNEITSATSKGRRLGILSGRRFTPAGEQWLQEKRHGNSNR